MTTKLVALYKKPADVQAFEKAYTETHLPLVRKMPGLQDVKVTHLQKNIMGGQAPYYMIVELSFENEAALNSAMSSPEGKAAGANIMSFAADILTMLVGEETETLSLAK